MADNVVIYAILHQPRRPRLPAFPLSDNVPVDELDSMLFDDTLNQHYFRKVASYCYHPAGDLFWDLVNRGLRLSLGFSVSFLQQASLWDPHLLEKLRRLVAHENVDLVCVEPYHSFIFYLDIQRFKQSIAWARDELERIFGKRPQVSETTEMFMCKEIYHALGSLGFKAALAEGRDRTMGWRSPTYLYHQGKDMSLFVRHKDLSDDVGYRFSQRTWSGYPLTAPKWADWLKNTAGDFAFVGWDFETFGEHHGAETGIFEFLRWLPGELHSRGVRPLTLSQAADEFKHRSHHIDLPVTPTTWAGLNGDPEFFLGNGAQFEIFLLMKQAYNLACLTRDARLIDTALWLSQSDNLHLLQWWGSKDRSEAEVSSYFTPGYWWNLGAPRIPAELKNVFLQFIGVAARSLARRPALMEAELADVSICDDGHDPEPAPFEPCLTDAMNYSVSDTMAASPPA